MTSTRSRPGCCLTSRPTSISWASIAGTRSVKTLDIASLYLRAVCQNRNLWGVEDFQEITIRHSNSATVGRVLQIAPVERFERRTRLHSAASSSPRRRPSSTASVRRGRRSSRGRMRTVRISCASAGSRRGNRADCRGGPDRGRPPARERLRLRPRDHGGRALEAAAGCAVGDGG